MGQALKNRKHPKRSVILLIAATVLWMLLIFGFSSQNALRSGAVSSRTLRRVLAVITPGWSSMTKGQRSRRVMACHRLFRKLGHFTEYAVLGIFLTLLFRPWDKKRQPRPVLRYGLPLLVALLYAASDELHQRFVPGRSCELRDVLIDLSGALFGFLLCGGILLFTRRRRERRARRQQNADQ